MHIGIISDTHGLLRSEAVAALEPCQLILHGGDIGGPEILETLRRIAPVHAVRGNNDRGAWADRLPEQLTLELGGLRLCLLHDLKQLARGTRAQIVVSGHSHRPLIERRDGVLYINPGSAGPRRFRLPISLAHLHLHDGQARAELQCLLQGTESRP